MKTVKEILQHHQAIQRDFENHKDRDKIRECMDAYCGLLNQAPEDPEILFQLATAHLQLGQFGVGVSLLKRVLAQWPASVDTWSNLGCCYRSIHFMPEARAAFLKALGLEERAEVLSNLTACYVNEGEPEKGVQYAMRAIEIAPDNLKAQWNMSLLALELEQWEQGFSLYDAGLQCMERQQRNYGHVPIPWWDGTDGKTVVVYDEQGLGDRLMAMQLIPHFKDRITIIIECHPRLVDVYRRAFPWIEHIYGTVKEEMIEWPLKHGIDARCALFSLAKYVWGKRIFDRAPYLGLERNPVPGRIGFSWAGGAQKTNTAYRSLKLGWFAELMATGGEWVSFQYNDWAPEKIARFKEEHPTLNVRHFGDTENYDDTLKEMATCELVITACNSIAHTCGAAGIPCWVLVPQRRAWRYPLGESSPFYSDAFVQIHQLGDWRATLAEVKTRLEVWHATRDHRARAVAA